MRFECNSCHAKYKISDDKVRGRMVRFPCRNCDHKILIDGRGIDADVTVPAGAAYGFDEVTRRSEPVTSFEHEAPTARARRPSRPSAPVRRRPPSIPPRRPPAVSRKLAAAPAPPAMSAVVREGQHPGLAPPVPAVAASPTKARAAEVPEWHVSIHDVPIGPIRLEEMAHKIDSGAVSEYSLVWRHGFEEWRPLATVPELMALLHQRRASGLPARTSFSSMPPFVDSHAAPASSDDLTPLADSLGAEIGSEPLGELSQPPAPIGPEDLFGSSPSLGSFSGLPPGPDEAVSVPSVPPEPAAATAEPPSRLSLGVLVFILSIVVFSGVVAFLAFERYGDALIAKWLGAAAEDAPTQALQADDAPVGKGAPNGEASAGVSDQAGGPTDAIDTADADGDRGAQRALLVAPPNPAADGPTIAPARARRTEAKPPPRPDPVAAAPQDDSLSDEEEKVLRESRSSSNAGPAQIDVQRAPKTKRDEPPLDDAGVRATVTANKPRLQRCYERAIRGHQSPPTVRLDVTVMVASSGRVKDVSAEGSGPGGLAECVEASVRRWRFPASSEGGPAKFPIVFSAN
jgi:predicted Zn finger-like uncharacterized protein